MYPVFKALHLVMSLCFLLKENISKAPGLGAVVDQDEVVTADINIVPLDDEEVSFDRLVVSEDGKMIKET